MTGTVQAAPNRDARSLSSPILQCREKRLAGRLRKNPGQVFRDLTLHTGPPLCGPPPPYRASGLVTSSTRAKIER